MATVQTRSAQNSGDAVVSITTTAGNLLGVVTGAFGASATLAPTRTGETFNSAVADLADGANNHLRGDYAMNIGGNANTVTGKGNGQATACCVTEFSGRKTTGALGATNPHATSSTTTVQPGSITPTAGSDLMTGVAGDGSGSAVSTINSGFATADEAGGTGTVWDEAGSVGGTSHKDNVGAVAVNPTWTTGWSSTGNMGTLLMEFLAAAGGAAVEISHLLLIGVT